MNDLIQNGKRDPWGAIRGFSYQIKTTVLRWLELDSRTVLLCECGEDISRIRQHLDSVTKVEKVEQLLEQVKHREKAVTLASPEVMETLANFHGARQRQRGRDMLLRYTTNAPVGREQRFRFPKDMPGIEAWQRITSGAASPAEVGPILTALRNLVKAVRVPKPRSRSGKKLSSFQRFVASASDDELVSLVKAVEWAVCQRPHPGLQTAIEDELVGRGLAPPRSAQMAATKLVVTVLDVLSRPGLKRLDRPLLLGCLGDVELSASEEALLSRVQRIEAQLGPLPGIASDVREIKAASRDITDKLDGLAREVALLGGRAGAMPGVLLQASAPSADKPPLPPHPCASRDALVESLQATLDGVVWLHLTGGAGMGKTHLARALAERVGQGHVLWVSLGSARDEGALLAHVREQVVAWVCTASGESSWWSAYREGRVSVTHLLEATLAQRSEKTLVVVDDLPDLMRVPGLGRLLSELALTCRSASASLVTTGQRRLIPDVADPVPPSSVAQEDVPKMDADDVMAMLQAASAAAHAYNPGFANFLCSVARGHPSILSATIRWCAERDWRFREGELTALFSGEAAADTRETAVRQMVKLVPNDNARELICRLSLIGRPFGRQELQAVADADPNLSRPGELLLELVGPWVNQLGEDSWEVSPLLSSAGAGVLSTDVQQGVHLALARAILSATSVGFLDAVQAIVHLMLARAWLDSAGLMIHVMSSVRGQPEAAAVWPLALLFAPGSAWPVEIPLAQRVLIRAFQIRASCLDGRDTTDLQKDLDDLIGSAGDDPDERRASLVALLNAGPLLAEAPPATAARRALQAARLLRTHPELAEVLPPFVLSWEELVLFPIARVANVSDGRGVLQVLREMTADELHAAFGSDLATQFLDVMADRCLASTHGLPEDERDWDPVLGLLDDLRSLAVTNQLERLETVARCAQAATLADYLGRHGDALMVLEETRPSDPVCKLLRHHVMACILFDMGRFAECGEHLALAVRTGGPGFASHRFSSYALAAEACGRRRQWRQAVCWAAEGIRYANAHRFRPDAFLASLGTGQPEPHDLAGKRQLLLMPLVQDLNRLELTGELALALWYAKERKRSWGAMFGLVRELSDAWDPKDRRYREVFRKTGHVLRWLSSMSASGAPPIAASDGGEYAAPWLGIFVRQRQELADITTPLPRSLLWYLLGVMAAGVGLRGTSLRSLWRAVDMATTEGQISYRHMALLDIAIISGSLGLFGESLDAGLEAIKLYPAAREYVKMEEELPASFPDPAETWKELPQERKCAAQEELFWLTIGPAILNVLTSDRDSAPLARWRDALHGRKSELANPEYWDLVMDAAQMVVEPAQRCEINAYLNTMSPDDTALIQTLCLAIPEAVGARPEDVVYPHGLLMAQMLMRRTITEFAFGELSTYVISYWANVAAAKAFQLRLPSQFKERMASVSSRRDLATACRVLLWAEEATGASLPDDMRQKLQQVVEQAGS